MIKYIKIFSINSIKVNMNKVALFVVNAENLKTLKYRTFLEKHYFFLQSWKKYMRQTLVFR